MKVREILKVKGSQVYTIRPDQTVLDAVAILMQHRIGALLVRDGTGTVSASSASVTCWVSACTGALTWIEFRSAKS